LAIPKCLIELAPQVPYLACQLAAFERFEFSRRLIVGGFGIGKLADYLASAPQGRDWLLLNNAEFHKGNLYSLKAARPRLNGGFFIFNADHFYSPESYRKIFACVDPAAGDIMAFCDRDRLLAADDMKVAAASDRLRVMSKSLGTCDCGYVGVTYVPAGRLGEYWRAFDAVEQHFGDAANVELVLNQLAEAGPGVRLVDISGSWWSEIDTPEDLVRTRALLRAHGILGDVGECE
jgi:choline kinase